MLRYVQPVKKDFHDWDMTSPPALIRTAGGRQIAAAAGKNGILYAIDRSGVAPGSKSSQAPLKIVYATPVTTRSNVKEPFNTKTETRFCPGTQGGAEWNGPALHPPSNLLLVNAVDWCASVKVADAGMVTGGAQSGPAPEILKILSVAAIPKRCGAAGLPPSRRYGTRASEVQIAHAHAGGGHAHRGGRGLHRGSEWRWAGSRCKQRTVLWRNSTGAALGGGVITYQTGGHQRIAVAIGMSPANWPVPKTTGRIVVFRLP
jgi:alcohol dehydrogenase (cytochrome c)